MNWPLIVGAVLCLGALCLALLIFYGEAIGATVRVIFRDPQYRFLCALACAAVLGAGLICWGLT